MNTFKLNLQLCFQKACLFSSRPFLFLAIVVVLFFAPKDIFAQKKPELDPQIIRISNQVMKAIFQEILSARPHYKELANFGVSNLKKNKYGINVIEYKEVSNLDSVKPFELGVSVVPLDVADFFDTHYQAFDFTFPFLGVKVVAYQVDNKKSKQFDLSKSINKHGRLLLDLQQDYMPFRMKIVPDKPSFQVGEKIGFTVKLINHSPINLEVLKISEETLYLNIDGTDWGSDGELKDKTNAKTILRSGNSIEKHFDVEGYDQARNIEVYGSYNLAFKGIKPAAFLKIPVVKKGL